MSEVPQVVDIVYTTDHKNGWGFSFSLSDVSRVQNQFKLFKFRQNTTKDKDTTTKSKRFLNGVIKYYSVDVLYTKKLSAHYFYYFAYYEDDHNLHFYNHYSYNLLFS